MSEQRITYKDAGVDIDKANTAKKRIRQLARQSFTPQVLADIGGFGGMFAADFGGMQDPVLVASTDGVGTKLKVAVMMNRHNTIGADLVNHCVNDILVQGARPLFFMDYIAMGRLDPEVVVSVVEGFANGCRLAGCALIGGETAEMPGLYPDGEYDVAGFIVGVVSRGKILDGKTIGVGDVLIGLPSAGLHTNGYSLARKLFFDVAGHETTTRLDGMDGSIGEELLKPHVNYEPVLREALSRDLLRGMAHITGGGITENLDRILPAGCKAEVHLGTWPVLPLIQHMQRIGNIHQDEMLRSTNMGIGMILVVRPTDVDALTATLKMPHYRIGNIIEGDPIVVYRP